MYRQPQRLEAVYQRDLESMLAHAIHKALLVSLGLFYSPGSRVLEVILLDDRIADRASNMILDHIIDELTDESIVSSRPHFDRLVDAIGALAEES